MNKLKTSSKCTPSFRVISQVFYNDSCQLLLVDLTTSFSLIADYLLLTIRTCSNPHIFPEMGFT
ncbi:hypothetical protein QTP88_010858 [Uroleucon formosanum]